MSVIKSILHFIISIVKYIIRKKVYSFLRKCRHEWRATSKPKITTNQNVAHNSQSGQSMPEYCIGYYLQKYQINFKYRYKKKCADSKRREIDFYLPTYKIGIEYDGFYWHKYKVNKDTEKNLMLKKENIRMIRIREKGLGYITGSDNIIINDMSEYSTYKFLNEPLVKLFYRLGIQIQNIDIDIERDFKKILCFKKSLEKITA